MKSAPMTFSFVGGVFGSTAGCERKYATMAWTSPSLRLRKASEGMMIRERPVLWTPSRMARMMSPSDQPLISPAGVRFEA
jgi:hypothetical protein